MPRGGARPGAGRKPGQVSQAKRDLADLASDHAVAALSTLATIAAKGKSEAARVSAAVAILDRAYGKPAQSMTVGGDPDNPLQVDYAAAAERFTSALSSLIARSAASEAPGSTGRTH